VFSLVAIFIHRLIPLDHFNPRNSSVSQDVSKTVIYLPLYNGIAEGSVELIVERLMQPIS